MWLKLESASGLSPKTRIVCGEGYSREEIKAPFFERGLGLVSDAIQSTDTFILDIARRLGFENRLVGGMERLWALESLFRSAALRAHFPEWKSEKKNTRFLRSIDRALQQGRLSFNTLDEALMYHTLLQARGKLPSPDREPLLRLCPAWESWLESQGAWDLPLALSRVTTALREGAELSTPFERVLRFEQDAECDEPRQRLFWEELGRRIPVECVTGWEEEFQSTFSSVEIYKTHAIEDSALFLGEEIDPDKDLVLIADQERPRQTLFWGLGIQGHALFDARDPGALALSESVKSAIQLWKTEKAFLKKQTLPELKECHLRVLKENKFEKSLLEFWENFWLSFEESLGAWVSKTQPVLGRFWTLRAEAFLQTFAPPSPEERSEGGVSFLRLGHVTFRPIRTLWIYGVSAGWASETRRLGDRFWSASEREVLLSEFAVVSRSVEQRRLIQGIRRLFARAERVCVLDPAWDELGKERESVVGDVLSVLSGWDPPPVMTERLLGGHAYFRASDLIGGNTGRAAESLAVLPRLKDVSEIRATDLDRSSRCLFQALLLSHWKLGETRDPELELWPEERGVLLHEAVRHLSLDLNLPVEEALERAWTQCVPRFRGYLASDRVLGWLQARFRQILRTFVEKEKELRTRVALRVEGVEGPRFRFEWQTASGKSVWIRGVPDRFDEIDGQLWMIDYKTGSDLPHGKAMVEEGYRVQLPVYALILQDLLKKPVLGAQFIELTTSGARSKGIFPKESFGKEPGKAVTGRRSDSVFEQEASEVWAQARVTVDREIESLLSGTFEARPKRSEECDHCRARLACGQHRRSSL